MTEDTKALKELLEAKLDVIADTTSKLVDMVYGNGQDGLFERVIRIEDASIQAQKEAVKAAEAAKEAVVEAKQTRTESGSYRVTVTEKLDAIQIAVTEHHADKDLHSPKGILLRRNVIMYFMLAFLILHSLIPPNFSVWKAIEKFFGIQKPKWPFRNSICPPAIRGREGPS